MLFRSDVRFTALGEFPYFCAIHPNQTGVIVVVGSGDVTSQATADARAGAEYNSAIIALKNRNKIIDMQLRRLRRNISVLDSFFSEYGDYFQWHRPLGSSVSFPSLLFEDSASSFCEKLLKDTGVLLVPSGLFDFGDQHVRVGFGREDLPQVINRFAEYLDQYIR